METAVAAEEGEEEDVGSRGKSVGPMTWLFVKSMPRSCFSLQWLHTSRPIGRILPDVV